MSQPPKSSTTGRLFLPPHSVRRDFLPADMVAELFAYAQANEERFVVSGVGVGPKRRVNPALRVSRLLRDLGPLGEALRDRFRPLAPLLVSELKMSPFEPGKIEVELAAHGDGAFYKRHLDTPRGADQRHRRRVLSGVYYFHAQPKGFSGGALRLHDLFEDGVHLDIEPENNLCIFFPSWMPHEVRPVACPSNAFIDHRFAINCWFHRAA